MEIYKDKRPIDLAMGSDGHGFYTYYGFPKSLSRTAPPVIKSGVIEEFLRRHFFRDTTLPRFTPPRWHENDICRVTKAGVWYEYEIKISRSDFLRERTTKTKKVTQLETDPSRGPNYYYFVCPIHMLRIEEIPSYAGLIVVDKRKHDLTMEIVKIAPKRSQVIVEGLREMIHQAFYYRQSWRINPFDYFEDGAGV